jgi:hypothetical protein
VFFTKSGGIGPPFDNTGDAPEHNDATAAYFLLVHYRLLPVDVFVCPSTDHEKDPLDWRKDPTIRSNFVRTDPLGKEFSYSFANPYPANGFPGNTYQYRPTDPADLALAADRNDGDRWRTLDPDAGAGKIGPMNSSNHRRKGQNVLFNDHSVQWKGTPFVGRGRDNIYTRAGDTANKRGTPADKFDSLLIPMFPLKNELE